MQNQELLDKPIWQMTGAEFLELAAEGLPAAQAEHFNKFFEGIQEEYIGLFGDDIIASIRRLGLITFRIAMVLDALRINEPGDGDISSVRYCSDTDYHTAHTMVQILLKHTATVFQTLPENEITVDRQEANLNRQALYNALPATFTRQEFLAIAATLNIKSKAAEKYVNSLRFSGLVTKPDYNRYEKIEKEKSV